MGGRGSKQWRARERVFVAPVAGAGGGTRREGLVVTHVTDCEERTGRRQSAPYQGGASGQSASAATGTRRSRGL